MATRRFKVSVGETHRDVVQEVGAAVNSDTFEFTVELAATIGGASRAPTRQETLEGLMKIVDYIAAPGTAWPPA